MNAQDLKNIDKIIEELKEAIDLSKIEEDQMNDQIESAQNEIQNFYQLDDKHVNQIFSMTDLANLCLFYEDLSNKNPEAISSALMSVAYEELKLSADEFHQFVKFIAKKKSIRTSDGIYDYMIKLGDKIQKLSNELERTDH